MDRADVIVVGGGPAGSITALLLARAGARVRLFDRARFPRRKLCGDTVNPGTRAILKRLGLSRAAEAGALRVDGMIVSGAGAVVRGAYPRGVSGLAITRALFDARLVEAAAGAGVEINEGALVTAPICEGPESAPAVTGVRVLRRGGGSSVERAPLSVAADGHHSRLAFALGLSRHPRRPRRWAVGAYYSGVEEAGSFGEMHVRDGYYLGVAAVPGGLTNVCLVTADRERLRDPDRTLRLVLAEDAMLRDRFAAARRASPVAVLGPLAVESSGAGITGLLLAGDAAGFIDPMTGDGLRFACRGAELAAIAAREFLEGRECLPFRRLAQLRTEFSGKRTFNRALRAIVDAPRVVRVASAASRLAPGIVRSLIDIAGDVRAA